MNLEYLAKGVFEREGVYLPDSLVGTDSHTTMINGLGIVGWGVGGIEAEAGMLGQPVYFLTPDVVGVNLTNELPQGATATDLVLRITEMLRKAGVVGKFVEFYGKGATALNATDRATIANMAPEYGATMGFFGTDEKTLEYFRATGRSDELVETIKNYYQAQEMFGIPEEGQVDYSLSLDLDLHTINPSVAGPKRPQGSTIGLSNSSQSQLPRADMERMCRISKDALRLRWAFRLASWLKAGANKVSVRPRNRFTTRFRRLTPTFRPRSK